jgi:hypothetical protein
MENIILLRNLTFRVGYQLKISSKSVINSKNNETVWIMYKPILKGISLEPDLKKNGC